MSKAIDSKMFANQTYERLVAMHQEPELYRGWSWGIPELDNHLGGIRREYIVASGKTGKGKTALIRAALLAIGRQRIKGQPIRFYVNALEETLFYLGVGLFAALSEIERNRFRDLGLLPTDWGDVRKARDTVAAYGGYWAHGITNIRELDEEIKELDPDLVVVDYIQLMGFRGSQSMTQEISQVSGYLQRLAQNEERPRAVLAAAQLNDDGQLLWSRDIGRDADTEIMIEDVLDDFERPMENRKLLKIRKGRYAGVKDIQVAFNGPLGLMGSLIVPPSLTQKVAEVMQQPFEFEKEAE